MIKKAKKTSSLGYFNLARGVGIVLVILYHTAPMSVADEMASLSSQLLFGFMSLLGAGMMMSFFLISGYGFFSRKMNKCIRMQAKLLLKPYYLVAVLAVVSKLLLAVVEHRSFWEHGGELVLTYLLAINYGGGGTVFGMPVDTISIFWFIWALFGGWIIYNAITRLENEKLQHVLSVLCVLVAYGLTLISEVWAFCIPMMLLAAGALACGSLIRKHDLLEKKLPVWVWLILFVPMAATIRFGRIDIAYCVWQAGLIDVISAFCAGFVILRLFALTKQLELNNKLTEGLELIGAKSIVFFCIHAYEKVIFPWYRVFAVLQDHPVAASVICFALRCMIILVIYVMIERFHAVRKKKRRKKIVLE